MEICKAPTLRLKALNKHWTLKKGKNTIIMLGLDTERGGKNTTITLGLDTERGQKTQQSCWAWTVKEGSNKKSSSCHQQSQLDTFMLLYVHKDQ